MPPALAALFSAVSAEESVIDAGATCGEDVTSVVAMDGWALTVNGSSPQVLDALLTVDVPLRFAR